MKKISQDQFSKMIEDEASVICFMVDNGVHITEFSTPQGKSVSIQAPSFDGAYLVSLD
jgi:hypothetical protein